MRKTSNLDQAFIGTLWCENIKHSLWAEGGSGQFCMSWVLGAVWCPETQAEWGGEQLALSP